eukprot:scaffold72669_cov35-Tisochrysis_lutea.AAC.1
MVNPCLPPETSAKHRDTRSMMVPSQYTQFMKALRLRLSLRTMHGIPRESSAGSRNDRWGTRSMMRWRRTRRSRISVVHDKPHHTCGCMAHVKDARGRHVVVPPLPRRNA